jgi:hypothetical protein
VGGLAASEPSMRAVPFPESAMLRMENQVTDGT